MIEQIEFWTALITLLVTLAGIIFKEETERKKDYARALNIQQQNQYYNNINTKGDNSPINIQSIQNTIPNILIEDKENEVHHKNFSETFKITNTYLKVFIGLIYVVMFGYCYYTSDNQIVNSTIYLSSIIFSGLSIVLIIGRVYKYCRRHYSFSLKNSTEDRITKVFRKIQQIVYPLIICFIQFKLVKFFVGLKPSFFAEMSELEWWNIIGYYFLFFLSVYWFYKISQMLLLNNIRKIKYAYLDFFFSIASVVIVLFIKQDSFPIFESILNLIA